jgi:hypothetical protein
MNLSIDIQTSVINQVSSYINLTLFFIGIIENLFCIYAFSRKEIKLIKFNLYLLVSSIFELIFCLILFLDYSFHVCNQDRLFLHQFNKILNVTFDYFVHTIDSYLTTIINFIY